MAQWQRTLDIHDSWQKAKEKELSIQALAGEIAAKLGGLKPLDDVLIESERLELVEEFQCVSQDSEVDVDDFDGLMEQLYDWADRKLDDQWNGKRVCWVNTAFPRGTAITTP